MISELATCIAIEICRARLTDAPTPANFVRYLADHPDVAIAVDTKLSQLGVTMCNGSCCKSAPVSTFERLREEATKARERRSVEDLMAVQSELLAWKIQRLQEYEQLVEDIRESLAELQGVPPVGVPPVGMPLVTPETQPMSVLLDVVSDLAWRLGDIAAVRRLDALRARLGGRDG